MLKDLVGDNGVDEESTAKVIKDSSKEMSIESVFEQAIGNTLGTTKKEETEPEHNPALESLLNTVVSKIEPDLEQTFVVQNEDVEIKILIKEHQQNKDQFKEIFRTVYDKVQPTPQLAIAAAPQAPIAPVFSVPVNSSTPATEANKATLAESVAPVFSAPLNSSTPATEANNKKATLAEFNISTPATEANNKANLAIASAPTPAPVKQNDTATLSS